MPRMTSGGLFCRLRSAIAPLACVLLFAHAALGFSKASVPKPAVCIASDPTFDDTSDVQGVIHYESVVRQLLTEQKFAELDCFADAARTSKARFASGAWRLNVFYGAISAPQGHATGEDWTTHLENLNRWVSAKPESINAHVALADAYTAYAWNARGNETSDTVTQSGWKLFDQRIEKAKETLEEASKLKTKCPHWYSVMQVVALAEGWNLSRATRLLDEAIAFEPDYHYYYRNYAHYLKPQWYGEEGDPERFAEQAANRIGGAKGDILYYKIAVELICNCSNTEAAVKLMSWPRIQKGRAELEKQNGLSLINLNVLAFMAIKETDSVVARQMFSRIGDGWDKDTWKTRSYFDSSKTWAAARAAYEQDPGHLVIMQAQEKFAPMIQQCAQTGGDMTKFALVIRLQKDGVVDSVELQPETKVGLCLKKLKGEIVSPPPTSPFLFWIPVDPAQLISASAH
jgi:hypothetical protein